MSDDSILNCRSLEEWLESKCDDDFPNYNADKGEKSYPEMYKDLKNKLLKYHENVEKFALVQSINDYNQKLREQIAKIKEADSENSEKQIEALEERINSDQMVYLNQHGTGHVEKVMDRALDIIKKFRTGFPTPSEIFILLCAIQIHDIGNINGRDYHETSFESRFNEVAKDILQDSVTRKNIFNIARVHSGNIQGSKDTIGLRLQEKRTWFKQEIREQMLASLLRFSDELADDSSRCDRLALEENKIPDMSRIFHEYSNSLHAVNIKSNDINGFSCYVALDYYVDTRALTVEYPYGDRKILLIDEIFSRTKKMERERRYCMRFLSPYISLTEIRVMIEIDPGDFAMPPERIKYTLRENGYPSDNDIIIETEQNTGVKVKEYLKYKGWRIDDEFEK